jgi:TP901 family phage tail tape measure protein
MVAARGKAVIEVRADTSRADKQIKSSAAGITSAMRNIGLAFSGYMVANFFRDASKAARVFEDDLANINSLLEKSHPLYGQFREDLLKLKQAIPVLELHDLSMGFYESISAGIDATNALEATTTMAYAAAGGQAELSTVVKGTTTLMNAYKMSTDDAMKATDIGLSTVRAAKLHYDEYAQGISMVASTAAVAGVSVTDLHAAIAVAARVQEPEQAFTGLNMAITSLYRRKPELAAMGIEVTTFADTMRQLHERKMTVGEWAEVMPDIRGSRTLMAIDLQFEDFIDTLKDFEDVSGTTMEMFATRTEEAGFKMAGFAATVEAAKIAIGQDLNVVLAENITLLDAFSDGLGEMNPELAKVVDWFSIWDFTIFGMISHWQEMTEMGGRFTEWAIESIPTFERAARGIKQMALWMGKVPGFGGFKKLEGADRRRAGRAMWAETAGAWGAGDVMPGGEPPPKPPPEKPKGKGKAGEIPTADLSVWEESRARRVAAEEKRVIYDERVARQDEEARATERAEKQHKEDLERIQELGEQYAEFADPSRYIIEGLKSGDMASAMQDFAISLGTKVSEELLHALFMKGLMAILNVASGGAATPMTMMGPFGKGGVVRAAQGLVGTFPPRPGGYMMPFGNKMVNFAEAGQPEVAAFLPPGRTGQDIILNKLMPMFNLTPTIEANVETRPVNNITLNVTNADRHNIGAHNAATSGKVNKAVSVRE